MIKPLKAKWNIGDVYDFNEVAVELLEEFIDSFNKAPAFMRPATEEEKYDERVSWVYTNRAIRLLDRFKDRLFAVGAAHFPEDQYLLDFSTYYILEP